MATAYPAALDTFTNPLAGDPTTAPTHAGQHTNKNDAIEAIEAELGTDPAGAETTVKARLIQIEADVTVAEADIVNLEAGTTGVPHPLVFYGLNMAFAGSGF